jgi:autotransporter-associated beta strand protein
LLDSIFNSKQFSDRGPELPSRRAKHTHKRSRTTRTGRPLYKSPGIEFLESRQAASSWAFDSPTGALSFSLDGDDSLAIYSDNGPTGYVSGTYGEVAASDVHSLTVNMGDGTSLDLSGFKPSDFSNLGAINIVSNGGQITITGSQIGEIIDTSAGYGTTILNVSDDGSHVIDGGLGSLIVDVNSGSGSVTLNGGSGYNEIYASGGAGNYTLDGGSGTDVIDAQNSGGTFTLNGGSGNDTMYGGNVLNGGSGNATLYGTGVLNDGGGTNVLYGNYGAPDPNSQGTGTLYDHGGINDIYNGTLYANGGSHNTVHNTGALYTTAGVNIVGTGSGYNVTNNVYNPTLNLDSDSSNNQTLSVGNDRFVGSDLPITTGDAAALAIVKSGAGTATLSGPNHYSGDTTINAGKLALASDASLGDTAIRVNSGGTFAPHPDVGIGTISAGGIGSGSGDGALLWFSGGAYDMTDGAIGTFQLNQNYGFTGPSISLYNTTLKFDLNDTAADQLVTSGSASVAGTNTISITGLGTNLTVGTSYNLITANAGLSLYGSMVFSNGTPVENLTVGAHSYTLALENSDTSENVTVVAVDRNIDYWIGPGGNTTWSTNTSTLNWSSTSGGTTYKPFANGDVAVFDNASQYRNVSVAAGVMPSAMIFNNDSSHAYTITDSGSNVIGGTGTAALVGTGSVTLVGQNTFSGLTTVNAGTLQLGSSAGLGSVGGNIADNSSLMFANPSAQTFSGAISGSGTLNVSGGAALTLSGLSTYTGPTTVASGATLKGGAADVFSQNSSYSVTGTLDLNGNDQSIGSLTGGGTVTNSAAASTHTLTVGSDGTSTTFNGLLADGSNSAILALAVDAVVAAAGTGSAAADGALTLTHANSFSGGTTVSGGTLALGGDDAANENANSLGAGPVTVSGGQLRLGGSTTAGASYTIPNAITLDGGTLFANDAAQHLGGLLTIASGGTLETQYAGKDIFLDGGITGAGPLAIDNQTPATGSGLGAVHFTTANDYSGTLTVNAPDSAIGRDGGLVQIDNNSALQDASVEMDGGHGIAFASGMTAPKFGNLTGSGNINLATLNNAAVNLTVGNDDFGTLYSGVLSGSGGLTKAGSNTLTLTGVSTFTGGTTLTGGSLRLSDNNHQILNPPPDGSTGYVPMDISGDFNLTGITTSPDHFTGGLDGNGLAIVDSLLGSTVNWNSTNFNMGQTEIDDVVQATGQDLNVTSGRYSQLEFLATAVGGNQAPQTFTVNYTDGSSATFNQGVSDWTKATNASLYSGETRARTMDHANTSAGSQVAGSYTVYGYTLTVDPTKTVSSITLPNDNHVVVLAVTGLALFDTPTNLAATPTTANTIHLSWTAPTYLPYYGYNVYRGQSADGESSTPLNGSTYVDRSATTFDDPTAVPGNAYYYTVRAVYSWNYYYPTPSPGPFSNEASAATPTSGPTAQADLASSFNLTGITSGGTFSSAGGIDGAGHAFSSTLLHGSRTWNNLDFRIGDAGSNNVVKATGQPINLPQGQYTQLEMLATAVTANHANQASQTFIVNYADGSSQTFSQGISDWTNGPAYGESSPITMAYVNKWDNTTLTGTHDIYGYVFNVASSKTVESITLPNNSNVIVLGITCQTANLLPATSALTIAPGAMLDLNGTNQQIGSIAGTAGDILLANSSLTVGALNTSTTFAGTFDGNGTLTKVGTGTLTLSGVNTYSGVTTVSGGSLKAGVADAFSPYSTYPNWPADNNWATELNTNGFAQVTPANPTNVFGTRATGSEIDLSWTDPLASMYQVEKQPSGSNTWSVLGTTTAASYAAVGLNASSQYTFRVEAVSPFGDSSYVSTPSCSTTATSDPENTGPSLGGPPRPIQNPVTGNTATVLVPPAYFGDGPFTYSWSATSVPGGAAQPDFSPGTYYYNGYGSPDVTATFHEAGDYTLQAIVTDANGLSAASSVDLTVEQTLTSMAVAGATVATSQSISLTASATDQFGNPMNPQPAFAWSVNGGSASGSIDPTSGVFSATSQEGIATITVSAGGHTATTNVGVFGNDTGNVYVQASDGETSDLNEVNVYSHSGVPKGNLPLNGPFPQGLTFHRADSISLADGSHLEASAASPYSLVRKNSGGTVIQTYIASLSSDEAPWSGMVLDPNGTSFWACDASCYVYEFEINSGAQDLRFFASDVLGKIGILGSGAAPTLDLLDDANNSGGIDPTPGTGSDEALKNTDPGKVILVSDAAADQNGDADSAHVGEMDITLTADTSNGATPANLTGWTLTLAPATPDSSTQIYGGLDKSAPKGSSESWPLSGNYSSGPFTAKAYVTESQKGKVLMQLTLAGPNGQGTSATAEVTADKPTLNAKTVIGADPKSGLTVYGGYLKHGDTAYVPVDNEDQYYVKDPNDAFGTTLVTNKEQSGPIKDDNFLLPVVIQGSSTAGVTYALHIPDNLYDSVKVWQTKDRTGRLDNEDPISLVNGTATVYVEGIDVNTGLIYLEAKTGGSDFVTVDGLQLTIFEIQGPQNVPNYSVYDYQAVGVPYFTRAKWGVDSDGGAKIVPSRGYANATIYWGSGGSEQRRANFKAAPGYIWTFFVNVVGIDIEHNEPALSPTDQTTVRHARNADGGETVVFDTKIGFLNGINFGANVKMTGPGDGTWGVDQVTVGFVQHVEAYNADGRYENGNDAPKTLVSSIGIGQGPAYPQLDISGSRTSPWYDFGGVPTLEGKSGRISGSDSPSQWLPTYYSQRADANLNPRDDITHAYISLSFILDVAAHVTTLDRANGGVYTRLATDPWYYDVNGDFQRRDGRSFNGRNEVWVHGPTWSDLRDGSQEQTGGPIALDVLKKETFKPL